MTWSPSEPYDTAYALALDDQFDSARLMYRAAVTSGTEPLEAHLGLIHVARRDPLGTVPVYPPSPNDPVAQFLYVVSTCETETDVPSNVNLSNRFDTMLSQIYNRSFAKYKIRTHLATNEHE